MGNWQVEPDNSREGAFKQLFLESHRQKLAVASGLTTHPNCCKHWLRQAGIGNGREPPSFGIKGSRFRLRLLVEINQEWGLVLNTSRVDNHSCPST